MVVRQPKRNFQPEDIQEFDEVIRPSRGYGAGAHRVFESQIPPDNPREELTERCIGVSISAPRQRNQRGKLGIAEARKCATESRNYERESKSRSCVVSSQPRENEDPSPDDRANAQGGE